MDVNLRPEHIERLNRLAEASGRGTDDIIAEAVHNYLEYCAWVDEKIERGIDDMNNGRFVADDEVRARIDRILKR